MARINNLTNFLSDVADAIRSKKGTSSLIPAEDFDTEIESITTGGDMQSKSITITENGRTTITPDTGYDGLNEVNILTSVEGGGSVGDFTYDDWITYGTSTPSVSSYKYWLPINTTPTQAPLKYVSGYKVANYFTDELDELVNENTESTSKSKTLTPGTYIIDRSTNTYYYCSTGVKTKTNGTLYKYVYTGQENAMYEATTYGFYTSLGTFGNLLGITQTTNYGAWTVKDNILYYHVYHNSADSIYYYNFGTGAKGLLFSLSGMGGTSVPFAFMKVSDTTFFIATVYSKGYAAREVVNTNGTWKVTTLNSNDGYYGAITVSNHSCFEDNKGRLVVFPMTSGTTSWTAFSSSNVVFVYNYSGSIKFTTLDSTVTFPEMVKGNTYPYKIVVPIPENNVWINYTHRGTAFYRVEYETIAESGNHQGATIRQISMGNLFKTFMNRNLSSLLYVNTAENRFRASINKNNFTIYDSNEQLVNATFSYDGGNIHNIEGQITKNYSVITEVIENIDSSSNVLLISNYKDNTSNIQYKFIPKPSSNIFLCLLRDYSNGAIAVYNKQIYGIKVSKNDEWISTLDDSENYIQ